MTWRTASDSRDDRPQRYGFSGTAYRCVPLRVPPKSQESCGFAGALRFFRSPPRDVRAHACREGGRGAYRRNTFYIL